jgi:hypothetical protein
MRLFEFQGFNDLVLLIKNLAGRAKSKKSPMHVSWMAINNMAQSHGMSSIDHQSFQQIYDNDASLQSFIKDFDKNGIVLAIPGVNDDNLEPQGETDINKIASANAEKQLDASNKAIK